MLQEQPAYFAVLTKVQIQGGPRDGEVRWKSYDDVTNANFTHPSQLLRRCTDSFVNKFVNMMNSRFP